MHEYNYILFCWPSSFMRLITSIVSPMPMWTGSTDHSPCPAVMPSPQKRKRKHLANRKFPRKQTPWNSHRPTPDSAVHRPDGTTNITSLHRTLKKKNNSQYVLATSFLIYRLLDSLVVECWLRVWEVPGSNPSQGPRQTNDVIKMVPVVPLFSTQH